MGREFDIQTNSRALMYINKFKDTDPMLMRWSLKLQAFQFQITHHICTSNGNADSLSRQYPIEEEAKNGF